MLGFGMPKNLSTQSISMSELNEQLLISLKVDSLKEFVETYVPLSEEMNLREAQANSKNGLHIKRFKDAVYVGELSTED